MSFLPFGPAKDAKGYFTDRLEKLVRVNEIRVMELLESFQYGIGYILVCFFLGVGLDFMFPKYDETKSTLAIFGEVVLQCLSLILFVFYGRKLVKIMPFMFNLRYPLFGGKDVPSFKAYQSTEYDGEVIIGFVLVATQTNLLKKIDHISKALYEFLFQAKRDTGAKLQGEREVIQEKLHEKKQTLEEEVGHLESGVRAIENIVQ